MILQVEQLPTTDPSANRAARLRAQAANDVLDAIRAARPSLRRSIGDFATDEIVLPDGPYEGQRFRMHRQPYTRLYLRELALRRFRRFIALGPTQSGKSFLTFVLPITFHLFELNENVVVGLPDMNMAADKWSRDIKPIIEKSQYADMLPIRGPGSREGVSKLEQITFRNGRQMRFMSAGGSDKKRSAYTTRVVVMTEVDGYDEVAAASREADPVTQIEGRNKAFGSDAMTYMECTTTIETGRIWSEYSNGSNSRIVTPCVHCAVYVAPEREHLVGWKDAESERQARDVTRFACPNCGAEIDDDDRREMNSAAELVHGEQTIDTDGVIHGDLPPTETFGFRWSAFHNLFQSIGDLGVSEFKASRADDEDAAEREMCQQVWAIPYKPDIELRVELSREDVERKTAKRPQGQVPAGAAQLCIGLDLGAHLSNWTLGAWLPDDTIHAPDYGRFEVPSADMKTEKALKVALHQFDERVQQGWVVEGAAEPRVPDLVMIDAGWYPVVVRRFCRAMRRRYGYWLYRPSLGRGQSQLTPNGRRTAYSHPAKRQGDVQWMGDHCFVLRKRMKDYDGARFLVDEFIVDVDHWKLAVQDAFRAPAGETGAMTLYDGGSLNHHRSFAKQITSEQSRSEWKPDRGEVIHWVKHGQNHWLDSTVLSFIAAHFLGMRLKRKRRPTGDNIQQPQTGLIGSPMRTPDGRPLVNLER